MGEIEIGGKKYNSVDEYINQSQCIHEWGEWEIIKAANCSETGLKRRKCTKCGGTYALKIGATIDYKEYRYCIIKPFLLD